MRWLGLCIVLLFLSQIVSANGLDGVSDQISIGLEIYVPVNQKNAELGTLVFLVHGSEMDLSEELMSKYLLYSIEGSRLSVETEVEGYNVTAGRVEVIEVDDSEETLARLNNTRGFIVLVGGPDHNRITAAFLDQGILIENATKLWGQYTIIKGETKSGNAAAAYIHKITGDGKVREAVKYSPLKGYVEAKYIPVVATGIGVALLALFNLLKTVIEFKALDLGRIRAKEKAIRVFGIEINEFLAIFGASFVLGLSVTWVYFGPNAGFLTALAINTGISFLAAISHEASHRLAGKILGIRVKYKFWWGGSLTTLISGFFGNAFGIQGFVMEYDNKDIKKWKMGLMKVVAPITSLIITIIAVKLYLSNPSTLYKTIYVTSSLWAMAEVLPMRFLDGYDILKWNSIIYELTFAAIASTFIYINFLM